MKVELRALVAGLSIAATACTSVFGLTDVPDASVGDGQDVQVSMAVDAAAVDGTIDAVATLDAGRLALEGGTVEASASDASPDSAVAQVDGETIADATPMASCSVANGGCDRNATCSSAGSVLSCKCNAGYSGTGTVCARRSIRATSVTGDATRTRRA